MSALSLHDLEVPDFTPAGPVEIVDCVLDQILGPTGTLTRASHAEDDIAPQDCADAMTTEHHRVNGRGN